MSGGKKNDSNKPRVELIPIEFTIGTAKALTYGANKYGDHNFREGIDYARLLSAAKRHLELEIAGIEIDDDSGNEHWMNVAASIAMYAFMKRNRPDLDTRYKYTEEQKKAIVKMMYGEGK